MVLLACLALDVLLPLAIPAAERPAADQCALGDMKQPALPCYQACAARTAHKFFPPMRRIGRTGTDVVVSHTHRFVYVDNVKAASTYIRSKLQKYLNATWYRTPTSIETDRTTSMHFRREDLRGYFTFSVVREPLAKFLSGVDQARIHRPGYYARRSYTSVVKSCHPYEGVHDEHLESNLWRLTGPLRDGLPVTYDFLGRVETFDEDWPYIVSRLSNLNDEQRSALVEVATRENVRAGKKRPTLDGLAADVVRKFCFLRRADYSCLGYALPAPCEDLNVKVLHRRRLTAANASWAYRGPRTGHERTSPDPGEHAFRW